MLASATSRISLVTVDQVISGASNLGVVLAAAHFLAPADFGLFALLYLAYGIALVVSRSLVSATVLAHPEDADHRPRAVLGSASALSCAMGVLLVVAGVGAVGGHRSLGTALLWMALLVPLALLQDVGRYLAIAGGRPGRAIRLDVVWVLVEAAGFAALALSDSTSLAAYVAVWMAGGAIGGVGALLRHGLPALPDLRGAWLRERWGFSWRMFLAGLAEQVSMMVALAVIAAGTSPAVVAAVQAVTLLTRPGYTVVLSVGQASVAEVARERPDARGVWRHVLRAVGITVAAAVVNLAAMLALPDDVGRILLGQWWHLAEPLLLPAGLQLLLLATRSGFRATLLGLRDVRLVLALDLAGTAVLVPLLVVGAAVDGASGVAWAGAAGQALLSVVWWLAFGWRLRSGVLDPDRAEDAVTDRRVDRRRRAGRASARSTRRRGLRPSPSPAAPGRHRRGSDT